MAKTIRWLVRSDIVLIRMPWWDIQGEFQATATEEQASKPRPRAADDFEEIRKRMQELEQMKQAAQKEKPATPVTIPICQDYC